MSRTARSAKLLASLVLVSIASINWGILPPGAASQRLVRASAANAASANRPGRSESGPATGPGRVEGAARAAARDAYGNLPLSFEANLGQADTPVRFLSRGNGFTLFLTPAGAVFTLQKPSTLAAASAPTSSRRRTD